MTVGQRIKRRRKELRLTQAQLAKRLGYTHAAAISKIELGHVTITTENVDRFAKVLRTTPNSLLGLGTVYKVKPRRHVV